MTFQEQNQMLLKVVRRSLMATLLFGLLLGLSVWFDFPIVFPLIPFSLAIWLAVTVFLGGVLIRNVHRRTFLAAMKSQDRRLSQRMQNMLDADKWWLKLHQSIFLLWFHIDRTGQDIDAQN